LSKPDWRETVRRWSASPFDFVLEALFKITEDQWDPWQPGTPKRPEGYVGPELWQGNFLKDVGAAQVEGRRRFAVRAGHGVGKTSCEAWVILWFLLFKRPSKVPITANSQDQLRDVVWAEIAHWHRELPEFLRNMIEVSSERVLVKADPTEAFAVARTARPEKPEALQGFHCFEEGTVDVLTADGWKHLEDVTTKDMVLTADPKTWESQYVSPSKVHSYDFDGELETYESRFIDFSVTPNHRFVYQHRQCNKLKDRTTERWVWHERELCQMHKGTNRVPKTFSRSEVQDQEFYEIPGCSYYQKKDVDRSRLLELHQAGRSQKAIGVELGLSQSIVGKYLKNPDAGRLQSMTVAMDAWLEFLGWFVAEGYVPFSSSGNPSNATICQTLKSNPENYARIMELAEELGFTYNCSPDQIAVGNRLLGDHLASLVPFGAAHKRVPKFMFQLSPRQIRIFLDAFRLGDGTGDRTYYTSSPGLADDIQRLIILAGGYATINANRRKGTVVEGLSRKGVRRHDYYRVREYTTRAVDFSYVRPDELKRKAYKGRVSCLSVPPHGVFYVRSRKSSRCYWTHNSENLAFFAEEASGIEDIIFETAAGALSSENSWVFMFANPTRTSGYFHRAFHVARETWRLYHVPCSASSRVSDNYARDIAIEHGEDSNVYRVRVLGEFPLSEDDAVIPLGLIEAAIDRDISPNSSGIVWGLDVARFGDDATALAKRRGNMLLEEIREWRKTDLMQTAGLIVKEFRETPDNLKPGAINVDVIGMGGGVVDRLRELGLPVRGVNVGEQPGIDRARYMRLRDELWFEARKWFDSKSVTIPPDDKLVSELVGPKYRVESSGKLKVESKDDMKKRGVKSPNKADAFCLTFAGGDFVSESLRPVVARQHYDPFNVGTAEFEREIRQSQAGAEYQPF
jgi:hypothetical protein